MSSSVIEFPPLLPVGRHVLSIEQLRALCVQAFPASGRRARLMAGLEELTAALRKVGLRMEAWIDGSFLTRKFDPDDVDIVVRVQGNEMASLDDAATQRFVDAMYQAERRGCHVSWFGEFPPNDPNYWSGEYDYCYWMRQWGFARDGEYKGIAVLRIESETGS
jgi:hypothetical protein